MRSSDQFLSSREFGWCVTLVVMNGRYDALVTMTGCFHQKGCEGRTDGPSVCPDQETLAFLLVTWSLFTGNLESLHSVVVLLLSGSRVQM